MRSILSSPRLRCGTMRRVFGQQPGPVQQEVATQSAELVHELQTLGWVDHTALAVVLVFCVIGLFKGLIWQVSRVAILVVAYVVAGRFGEPLGQLLARTPAVGGQAGAGAIDTPDTTLYLAYVLLFVAVLVVLSLLALLLQKLAAKAGLGFFDRLGGGVIGVATGACVVLFGLFVVHMFFQGSKIAAAAESSYSLRLSRRAIDFLGEAVPDDLRHVLALVPLRAKAPVEPAGEPGLHFPGLPGTGGNAPSEPVAPTEPVPPKRG
ncbi:MAG: CvpA family protein [Planctomycetes bacterium]|nr:CvpA family protein [Planctomycetota bacterium]